jgi:hypothetical protein
LLGAFTNDGTDPAQPQAATKQRSQLLSNVTTPMLTHTVSTDLLFAGQTCITHAQSRPYLMLNQGLTEYHPTGIEVGLNVFSLVSSAKHVTHSRDIHCFGYQHYPPPMAEPNFFTTEKCLVFSVNSVPCHIALPILWIVILEHNVVEDATSKEHIIHLSFVLKESRHFQNPESPLQDSKTALDVLQVEHRLHMLAPSCSVNILLVLTVL